MPIAKQTIINILKVFEELLQTPGLTIKPEYRELIMKDKDTLATILHKKL